MSNLSSETNALGICDRCGRAYKLMKLRKEYKNLTSSSLKVCDDCFDRENLQSIGTSFAMIHDETLKNPAIDNALAASRGMTVTLVDKTVSFVAANTNRINSQTGGGGFDTTIIFGTSNITFLSNVMTKSLVRTTNAEFSSLCNDAGILGSDFALYVSSAKLRVGENLFFKTYTNPGSTNNAYRVITDYDTTSVTWNSFGNGGTEGTNYTTDGSVEGVVGEYYVEWDFTDMVSGWLSGENENYGIFFPDMSTAIVGSSTPSTNVVWTITAKRKLF